MSNFENVAVLNELTSATPTPDLAELQTLRCCERPEVGIHWNAGMHHRIVERAKEGIEALQNDPRIGTYATAIAKSWDARSTSILKAIDDADWHAPYTDYLYSSHFYDPDTNGSWIGGKHALSCAAKYYYEAGYQEQIEKSRTGVTQASWGA